MLPAVNHASTPSPAVCPPALYRILAAYRRTILGLVTLASLAALGACSKPRAPETTRPERAPGVTATYQLGILRQGPQWTNERSAAEESLQAGHLRNMKRMYDQGLMIAAGPFLRSHDMRGLFVFGSATMAEVEREVQQDPRIQAGRLSLDLYTWEAPAGIGEPYRRRAALGRPDSLRILHLGLARRGPSWRDDEASAIQSEHEHALRHMIASGDLMAAGPVRASPDLISVMIFKSDSAATRRLLERDPAVQAGQLSIELHPWATAYGAMPGDTL